MKTLIYMSLLLFVGHLSAQNKHTATQNYITITRNIQQLRPIILAAEELAKEDGDAFGDYQVIICGKTVTELTEEETMNPIIELAKIHHVKLIACGFSLKKFHVDNSTIPHSMKVVDNGLLLAFQLQKKGYYSIEL